MVPTSIETLLAAWRAADRRWESTPSDAPAFRQASIDVLQAWLAYHAAVDEGQPGEFALIADDDRLYVAASVGVLETLGYTAESILGRRVEEFTTRSMLAGTAERWSDFAVAGRQDGEFDMRRHDGSVIRLHYQARAHYPIANFHLSRLWPARGD